MEQMQVQPAKIYAAIAGVISDVGYVAKDKINKTQGFKYRSVDDVFNALHPALAKNKVVIVPTILERESTVIGKTQKGTDMVKVVCRIKFTFFAEDGSFVESVIIGEGLDTGDKATNKAMAIAYKYVCFQVFCIPTEEMSDPDAERPEMELEDRTDKKTQEKKKANKHSGKAEEDQVPAKDPDNAESGLSGQDANPMAVITPTMLQVLRKEQQRTRVPDNQILGLKSIRARTMEELTVGEFKLIMRKFEATKTVGGEGNE